MGGSGVTAGVTSAVCVAKAARVAGRSTISQVQPVEATIPNSHRTVIWNKTLLSFIFGLPPNLAWWNESLCLQDIIGTLPQAYRKAATLTQTL